MFWKKNAAMNPHGVPLDELLAMLEPTSIDASIKGDTLVARHEHYTTRVDVVSAEDPDSENGPIQAVVRVTTTLPEQLAELFQSPESAVMMNNFAALGALSVSDGAVHIGSRLTIYEAEDAWRTLHCPLLLFTIIGGAEAILGGMRRTFSQEAPRDGKSHWTESDFHQVEQYLSQISVCTTGGLGLTAEFGLSDGEISAAAGHSKTALFQEMADQPHPELGAGLFCLLQMPHRLADERRLQQVCLQLNTMEMAAHDLPPHFGAWCEGGLGNNPAYVSFFPNALYEASTIDPSTLRAYLETEYRVHGEPSFTLRVGRASAELLAAQTEYKTDCSAFLTACNPFSKPFDPAANAARQDALARELSRRNLAFLNAVGQHPTNQWPGEDSFLVFGLTLERAKALGSMFEQNGFVWAGADAVPQLILLR
jgi:hypothetical protein